MTLPRTLVAICHLFFIIISDFAIHGVVETESC